MASDSDTNPRGLKRPPDGRGPRPGGRRKPTTSAPAPMSPIILLRQTYEELR